MMDTHAFIYLDTHHVKELKLMPWADFKSKFGLYHTIRLVSSETFCFCIQSLFKERGEPEDLRIFTKGIDRTHHFHHMPKELVTSRAKVMFQSANSMEMLHNTTEF